VRNLFALLTICIVTTTIPLSAAAQETAARRMALKEAVNTALEQNNLIKAAAFNADAAGMGIAITNSRYYPGIFFEEAFAASNSPTQTFMMKLDEGRFRQSDFEVSKLNNPSARNDFKTSLTLQQPLYDPATAPLHEMALKEAEKSALGLEEARQSTAFQVFRTYLEAQKASAQLTAAGQARIEARENMRLATVRSAAGVGLKSDELRARTHLAAMESHQITASNNLLLAQMRLAVVVGIKDPERIEPSETLSGFTGSMHEQELLASAFEKRSDLQQSRVQLEKSEAAVKLARNAYLPSAAAFASYQMNAEHNPFGNDNDAWMAGISLKWQLFDGFRRGREHDRANAGRSAAAETLEYSTREVAYQVRESLMRREEMEKRREVARHALLDAEETVRLLSRRFENSLSTLAELLDAQSALNQMRAGLIESEANCILASGQIYYTAGIFLKEMNK